MSTSIQKTQNGDSISNEMAVNPPPLPHMTVNITSLASILSKFTEDAYLKLRQIIETGSATESKKKALLQTLVRLREDTVRLYVLTKWSNNSAAEEFGKLIDLLSWMRGQTENFQALVWHMMNLNQGLLSAKLPNPDLITALEVLYNGKPTLPTHGLLTGGIDPDVALNSLKELNIICKVKYALVKDLPPEYKGSHYVVKDGRITVTTRDYKFVIAAMNEDAPFIMLDFRFLRSDETQTDELSEEDSRDQTSSVSGDAILNELHPSSSESKSHRLIKTCNEILKAGNFQELHRVLTNYTNTMKLYLLHCKLRDLKQIRHSYSPEKFQIVVHYWINSQVFRNSYLEIGLTASSNTICYKWYKQGEFVECFQNVKHVELLLREIYYRHSQEALALIDDLSINNKSVLQINEQTGLFYFKNPTPTLNESLLRLNTDDFKNINANLKDIRINLRFQELAMVLKITGWKINEIVRLPASDLKRISSKLFNEGFNNNNNSDEETKQEFSMKNWKFYTRNEWPSDWCLVLHLDTKIRAYIANISTVMTTTALSNHHHHHTSPLINNHSHPHLITNSGFKLGSFEELNLETFDYKSSKTLLKDLTKKIMTQLIATELHRENVRFQTTTEHNLILIETATFISGVATVGDTKAKPPPRSLATCSPMVYLHFNSTANSQETIDLTFKGKLTTVKNIAHLGEFDVAADGVFTIKEKVQFRCSFSNGKTNTANNQDSHILKGLKTKLCKLMKTLELMAFLEAQELILKEVKPEQLVFSYAKAPEDQDQCIAILSGANLRTLTIPKISPHHLVPLDSELSKVSKYSNVVGDHSLSKLSQLIKYLKESTSLIKFLSQIHSQSSSVKKSKEIPSDLSKLQLPNSQDCSYDVIFKSSNVFSVLYYQSCSISPTPIAELIVRLFQDPHTLKVNHIVRLQLVKSIKEDALKGLIGKNGSMVKESKISVDKQLKWFGNDLVFNGGDVKVVEVVKYLHEKIINLS